MPTRTGFILAGLVAVVACERTPTELSNDELKLELGSFSVAAIGSTADLTATDMDSLGRVAGNFTTVGGFRWSNGSITPLPAAAAAFVVTAINNRGDLAGTLDGHAALIFAESTFATLLTSIGDPIPPASTIRFLDDRREAVLTSPYGQSGLDLTVGMWRGGIYKALSSGNHYSKAAALNNRGTAILQYTDFYPVWSPIPSPFEAGPVPTNSCRAGRLSIAYALNDSTHTLTLDEISGKDGFLEHDFFAANGRCTDLTLTYPALTIRSFNNRGLLGGTASGKAYFAMEGASVAVDELIASGGWHVLAIRRINDHRQVLARATDSAGVERWVVLSPVDHP